jgi:TolB protein
MRFHLLVLITCSNFITLGQSSNIFNYCYENKKGICVYSLAISKEFVTTIIGEWPCISADGKEITFTQNLKGGDRCICVMNLTTNKIKVLNTNSTGCFGSVWSPDGRFISYNVIYKGENSNWGVAIIDTGNHYPIDIIKPGIKEKVGYFFPTWSADSKYILAHSLDTLFIFNLKGEVQEKIRIKEFCGSSASKFLLLADNKRIVFDSFVDDLDSWGFGESPSAIFIYDILSKKTTRLTPKGYCCIFPVLSGEKIYFDCYPPKSKIRDIYSIDLNGNNFKMKLKNCWGFSVRIN